MDFLFGEDEYVSRWVADKIPFIGNGFKNVVAIGLIDGNQLIAGVVYSEYRGNDIQMSIATTTPKWATRKTLKTFFAYPFIQLKCDRVSSCTLITELNTIKFNERLGFVKEGVVRKGFKEGDAVIFGMLREECKYLGDKNG